VRMFSRHFQAQKHYWIPVSSLQTAIQVLREVDLPVIEKLEMLWKILWEIIQTPPLAMPQSPQKDSSSWTKL
jgi:hypothetical protein